MVRVRIGTGSIGQAPCLRTHAEKEDPSRDSVGLALVPVMIPTQPERRPALAPAFADDPMIGKRVQFHEETWQELRLLAAESMKSFQELADEAFSDLLKKHGHPASLKEALRRSAGQSAKVIPLKRKARPIKDKR